ncbi:Nucleoside triphosphatase I [Bienertia sinuspersici]
MSQGYSIELYFDPALENQVLKAWNVLARRQISTQLIEIESRPHITLFSTQSFIDPSKIEPIIKSFAAKQEPLQLNFSSIGSLPNEGNLLFLSPTPTLSLLQFHTQLCDLLKKEGIEIGDDFRVDSWVPNCPVAQEVPKNRMAEAFSVLRDLKLPISGYAMDIGFVEFSPVRELFSYMIGNTVDG